MTVNLLKRLESSVHSFRLTLQSLANNHSRTLDKIEEFEKTGKDTAFSDVTPSLADVEPDEEFELPDPDDGQIGDKVQIRLSDMDLPSWKRDLSEDLALIEGLLQEMRKVTPADDAKLQHLKTTILSKLGSPINPGNKKVLIFTAFADTADYLYDQLSPFIKQKQGLDTGKVTGSDRPKSTLNKHYDFQSVLTLFSPRSKEKAAVLPREPGEIDVLIGTDCISEGQNLQDCDYLINYDIHWNPVRIIQRFGRIDRIGSKNRCIQLVNYWPDITLDEYINLKERVENRMVIADMTASADDNPLDAKANDVAYRREQLRRLQEEVIELEDLRTGISITDLGLNDFRMDLVGYIQANGDLARLPNGTCNPFEQRDGELGVKAREMGAGLMSAKLLPGARIVRAFNAIGAARMGAAWQEPGKVGMPIAGDDAQAIATASNLIRDIGYEPVLIGGLAMGRHLQPREPLAGERSADEIRKIAAGLK